jgi:peptidyl-tRNA hydrolase
MHEVEEAELEQSFPSQKPTAMVEVPMSVAAWLDESSENVAVRVSGQRHRCILKKPASWLDPSVLDEVPLAAEMASEKSLALTVTPAARAGLGAHASTAVNAKTKRARRALVRGRPWLVLFMLAPSCHR